MKEIYKTQSPKIVFVELTGVFFNRYEDFTESNILYMPWNTNRILATFQAAEPEKWISLLFPIYNYHVRWQELSSKDWDIWLNGYDTDPLCGYTYLDTAEPIEEITATRFDLQDNYEENISYLEKILSLGKENGSQIVFYIAPCVDQPKIELLKKLEVDLNELGYTELINFNESQWLDWRQYDLQTDFYDKRHFNYSGAEKFSLRLGDLITEHLGFTGTEAVGNVDWQGKWEHYNELKGDI